MAMNIRCICIDDELFARQGLALALKPFPELELIGEFDSVDNTIAAFDPGTSEPPTRLDFPDVMFVDIEMPRKSGFDLINEWPHPLPIVIFVTAYDQYAIKAFEQNALDYLLKPIDEDRFRQVVEKIKLQVSNKHRIVENESLVGKIDKLRKKLYKSEQAISLKTEEGYFRVKLGDILFIEAVSDHVCFHLKDKQLITRGTLKKYIVELADYEFYQIHKSYLVNLEQIAKINKLKFGDQQVVLKGGVELRMSRRFKSVADKFSS